MGHLHAYDVTKRYGVAHAVTSTVVARSPSAARYRAYLSADVDWPFGDWQRGTSVRRSSSASDECYDYVRRAYGLDVHLGQRVRLRNLGGEMEGWVGEVVWPGARSSQYVHVAVDGYDEPLICHPNDIDPSPVCVSNDGRR